MDDLVKNYFEDLEVGMTDTYTNTTATIEVRAKGYDSIRQARQATLRRARGGRPWVTAMKAGTRPIGSTTTTKVTRAEMRNSTGMSCMLAQMAPKGAARIAPARVPLENMVPGHKQLI